MPLAGRAAVVFRNVNVRGVRRTLANRLRDALFLDVRVERVIHHPQVRVIDLAAEAGRVGGRIEEVALEAVEVFEHQRHAGLFGVVGQIPEELGAPLPFVRRGAFARELADR
jgi:hypothetical protein